MKNTLKKIVTISLYLLGQLTAQNTIGVSIKDNPSAPHPSAMLEVASDDKGALLPRVHLTADTVAAPVAGPADGLIVYNTNAALFPWGKGLYYWSTNYGESKWIKVFQGNGPPKITFATMKSLTPFLNRNDLGMMVFVTDSVSVNIGENAHVAEPNFFSSPGTYNRKYYHVYGLWYLSKALASCQQSYTLQHGLYCWKYVLNSQAGILDTDRTPPTGNIVVGACP